MAMSTNVQYISYYTYGSAAKQVEHKPARRSVEAPKPVRRSMKRRIIRVDPLALAAIVLAFVMGIMLISGFAQYNSCVEENARMGQYILSLQQEQEQLRKTYEEGYDLEQIRQIANAIGMVPVEEANRITVEVQVPELEEPKLSFWDAATIFLAGLFA